MPFIKTALFPSGGDSQGENICHFAAVRMRIQGSGNLDMTMYSQDDVLFQNIAPVVMAAITNIQPTRLMSVVQQRAYLKLSTDVINEYFKINRMIVYTKEVFTSYPG